MSLQIKVTLDLGHFDGTRYVGGREATVAFVTVRLGGGTFQGRGFAVQAPVDLEVYKATTGEKLAIQDAVKDLPRVLQDAIFKVWRSTPKPSEMVFSGDWRRVTRRVWIGAKTAESALDELEVLGEIEALQAKRALVGKGAQTRL